MKRLHLIIKGRVQGVFFRSFTKDNARMLGLKGWVKNTIEGDVEVLLEGNKEDALEMLKRCRKGPPASNITDIEIRWEEYKGDLTEFILKF